MNEDVLERLLIDRALGALEPDVMVLLDGFLSGAPQAAREAQELQTLVTSAAEAVREPVRTPALPQLRRTVFRPLWTSQWLAQTAAFLAGAVLTALLLPSRSAPSAPPAPESVQADTGTRLFAAPASVSPRNSSGPLSFWSNQRVYALFASPKMVSNSDQLERK